MRELKDIQQETAELCAKIGAEHYNIHLKEKEIELCMGRLEELSKEAQEVNKAKAEEDKFPNKA